MDTGVDLQLQIFILAGVFGLIFIIIIFFLAGICGQISKIKRQQRKLHFDNIGGPITGYDNYAYNSRNIQPDEELGRRGFTMYDPYRNNNQTATNASPNVHQNSNTEQLSKSVEITRNHVAEVAITSEGSRDETSEYSIANTETIVMTGNDIEMKIKNTYPPEFRGIPPPPAFVNRLDIANEPNSSNIKPEERQ